VFFRQLIDADLGCACYVLGDHGRAVVVDPGLDIDAILDAAAQERATIELVLETHVHADHVSGRELLARRTGARVRVPAGGGIAASAGEPLTSGETLEIAGIQLDVLATPGHRPEHLAFAVRDRQRSEQPWLLLSGDSLLVGDLARPDLAIDPHDGAQQLHATVTELVGLGDGVELWPGHVGGSLCGGPGLAAKSSSTIGYERHASPLLRETDRETFARRLIDSLPIRPPTVARVVARNRLATPAATDTIEELDAAGLARALTAGAIVVDARPADAFDAHHLVGSISLSLTGRGVGTRAARVLPPDAELVVCADDPHTARTLARRLAAVALDGVVGFVTADTLATPPLDLATVPPVSVSELAERLDSSTLVDVRDNAEWEAGHVAGSIHVPLERLSDMAQLLPGDAALVVACATGPRAALAASWLRRAGWSAQRVSGGGVPELLATGPAAAAS
jgi:glyoxylase-like metal-dependent hydrolase (beta-lactamase superfamily II)/rhodanese-related sulfurtransferase